MPFGPEQLSPEIKRIKSSNITLEPSELIMDRRCILGGKINYFGYEDGRFQKKSLAIGQTDLTVVSSLKNINYRQNQDDTYEIEFGTYKSKKIFLSECFPLAVLQNASRPEHWEPGPAIVCAAPNETGELELIMIFKENIIDKDIWECAKENIENQNTEPNHSAKVYKARFSPVRSVN